MIVLRILLLQGREFGKAHKYIKGRRPTAVCLLGGELSIRKTSTKAEGHYDQYEGEGSPKRIGSVTSGRVRLRFGQILWSGKKRCVPLLQTRGGLKERAQMRLFSLMT